MFVESRKSPATNDIEIASHCSYCQSTSSTLLNTDRTTHRSTSRRSAKNFRLGFTMHHKFLLIYALLFVALSPTLVLCMRHHERPNESASSLSQTTPPPTNSIDSESSVSDKSENSREDDEDASDDESYEDRGSEYRSVEILNMYKTQYATFSKKENAKVDAQDDRQLTTMKSPARTLEGGSCLSTACLARQDIEKANEENIRKHILMKLGMPNEPNKTRHYPDLPQIVLERYCKSMGLSVASCFGSASPNVEYQSDGPINLNYDEDFNGEQETITEEEDVQFLSFENRIYAFPSTTIKPRHKSIMFFQFTESQESNNVVAKAELNLFVHSKSFLRARDMLPENLGFIDIEIAKVLHGSHKIVFDTIRNVSLPDAGSDGEFKQLNITQMVAEWFSSYETSHGLAIKIYSSATGEQLPHKIVALDAENFSTRPFIDVTPHDQRKKRTKRSNLHCPRGSNESRCCRHDLTVDFDKFGWDWIIAPKKYEANYCAGECKIAFMQQYAHTHVMQLSTAANPCCSPRKMTPMQLLYFDSQLNIVLGTIPNMIVEECFCS